MDNREKNYKRKFNERGDVVEKKCSICDEWKDIKDFVKDKSNRIDGYSFRCKKCVAKYLRDYRNGEVSERGEYYRVDYNKEYLEKKKKRN